MYTITGLQGKNQFPFSRESRRFVSGNVEIQEKIAMFHKRPVFKCFVQQLEFSVNGGVFKNILKRPGYGLFSFTNRAMTSSNHPSRPWHVSPARVQIQNRKIQIQSKTRRKMPSPKSPMNLSCLRAVFTNCAIFNLQCTCRYVPNNGRENQSKKFFSAVLSLTLLFFAVYRALNEIFKNAAIFSRFAMVPRPFAPVRAMRSRSCADVIQPCRHDQ